MDMINSAEVIRRIEMYLEAASIQPPPRIEPGKIELTSVNKSGAPQEERLTLETARHKADEFIVRISPYPGTFKGRGIVICGGGIGYFTCS